MENKHLFCLCWRCRRFHFVCLHLCLYPSVCTGLWVHISCCGADESLQMKGHRVALPPLCSFRQGVLSTLNCWVPGCLSQPDCTGKPRAAHRPAGPSCSEPFIWHLMQKMCPEQFQPCSIKLHYNYTAQSRRLKKTAPPQCNTLISVQR